MKRPLLFGLSISLVIVLLSHYAIPLVCATEQIKTEGYCKPTVTPTETITPTETEITLTPTDEVNPTATPEATLIPTQQPGPTDTPKPNETTNTTNATQSQAPQPTLIPLANGSGK